MTVILGSKPDPILPKSFDTIFFVNGSIYYKPEIKTPYSREIYIATNYALMDGRGEATRSALRSKETDHFIEIATVDPQMLQHTWEGLDFRYNRRTVLTREDRERITDAILPGNFVLEIFRTEFSAMAKARKLIGYLKPGGIKHVSTAVFGLCYAIHCGVGEPPYCLCGIGLESDGYSFHTGAFKRGHELADVVALRLLSRSEWAAHIFATDENLCRVTGVNCLRP